MDAVTLSSLLHVRGQPDSALDNSGLPRWTNPDRKSASRLLNLIVQVFVYTIVVCCFVYASRTTADEFVKSIKVILDATYASNKVELYVMVDRRPPDDHDPDKSLVECKLFAMKGTRWQEVSEFGRMQKYGRASPDHFEGELEKTFSNLYMLEFLPENRDRYGDEKLSVKFR